MINESATEMSFDIFYNTVNAYYRTAALKAALELGVFDVLNERGMRAEQIAEACQATTRGIRILCYFLSSIGFMKVRGEEFYLTREMGLFLSRRSPGYLGGSIEFLLSPYMRSAFSDLTSVVRTGKLTLPEDGYVAPEHPQWVTFARAMAPMMNLPSRLLASLADRQPNKPLKVLDVAAGHGLFGIALARKNPKAHVTFVDWNNVLDVARENAASAGVSDRCTFLPGDAFDVDLGKGYDVILLTNFLHHFDQEGCESVLRKVHTSLADDGSVYTFEFIANEDRISPSIACTFSMLMLGTTPVGETYAFSDLQRMFENTGFPHVTLESLPPALLKVVVSRKAAPAATRA